MVLLIGADPQRVWNKGGESEDDPRRRAAQSRLSQFDVAASLACGLNTLV